MVNNHKYAMKTLHIFFIFLLAASASAQWNKVEAVTSPLVFSALFSGNNIFAGTDTLFISRDKGINWEKKLITGKPMDATALFETGGRTFAGLYGGGVYQSTDQGDTWEPFSNGLSGFASYAKRFAISGDTLFLGTDGGGVYFLKLNSSVWQEYNQNLPSNYAWTINDLAISNTNIIASAGGSGFYYLRQKGSSEWTEKIFLLPNGAPITPNTFLTLGGTVFAGTRWGIFRSFDNGSSWDSVGVSALQLDVVSLTENNGRIYAGFTRASGNDFFVWYSDDYGDTWNFLDHQFQYLFDLYIYDNRIWAATNDGLWYNELNPTSVDPIDKRPAFSLAQNYPNPFNPETNITFQIAAAGFVSLKVYDVLGNEIAELINEEKSPGEYSVEFGSKDLSSGVYFYRLLGKDKDLVKTRKMILIK